MNDDKSVSGVHYVDAYQPPSDDAVNNTQPPADTALNDDGNSPMNDAGMSDQSTPVADMPTNQPGQPTPPVEPTQPAESPQPTSSPQPAQSELPSTDKTSESLEDQNIFFLLGVNDGTDEQKEKFLDELQQVIWEDFLEYDVKLLITSDEQTQLHQMMDSGQEQSLEEQEKVVVFLEKLIPDLEEIMLEKALELKEEMVRERAAGLRTYYADKPDSIKRIDEAEKLMDQGSWYSAAHLMNSLA